MEIKHILILLVIIALTLPLNGQFDFHVESLNDFSPQNRNNNPVKITEFRIQKDKKGNDFEAWCMEKIFLNNKVFSYSQNSIHRKYIEIYNWENTKSGVRLIRYDSTYYSDTTNITRYSSNLSKSINHQDTMILLFNENGNLTDRMNSNYWRQSYQYDEKNNLITFMVFNFEDSIIDIKSWKHKYDENGRISESKIYNKNELIDIITIYYEAHLQRKYRTSYLNDEPVSTQKTFTFFNKKGVKKKRLDEYYSFETCQTTKNEIRFNDQEDIILESRLNFYIESLMMYTTKHVYKYDSHKNWIERVVYMKQNDENKFKWFYKDLRSIIYE